MKLFQKLLLAPAALGLFAPIAANANESNFRDVTSYTQDQVQVSLDTFKPLSNKNPLLAGGEGMNSSQSDDFDVDTFSATTSAAFTSNFAIGKEGQGANEEYIANFDYEVALSSSFTGNDSLDVVMEAGKSQGYTELDMRNNTKLQVTNLSYSLPLGEKVTVAAGFGESAPGSLLYNTACVYGAQADTFSNCGISAANIDEGLGVALGASIDIVDGLTLAFGYEGEGNTKGLASEQSTDAIGGQLSYTGDNFGASVSYANIENHTTVTSGGVTTLNVVTAGRAETQSIGFNGYFAPDLENFPTISAGFETNHDNSVAGTSADETSHYFVGLQWDDVFDGGTFGAAVGSKEPFAENANALTMYEVFYSFDYVDGITITPIFYSKANSGATPQDTGVVVKSTFSF